MILSASRRTDIPAFYTDWLLNRLNAGYLLIRNPYNFRQVSRIDLSPEGVDCLVFWSKDPAPLLERLPELDAFGIPYCFQFTLTPYGRDLECNLREKEAVADTFLRLADRLGQDRVLWRYDPILLSEAWTPARHMEAFAALCRRLRGRTGVCTVSFVDLYAKIRKAAAGRFREPAEEEMRLLAAAFSGIGRENGVTLRACCERLDLSPYGIQAAGCIDRETVERVCGYSIAARAHGGQRDGCRCMESVDIGAYDTCVNGCVYCYANRSAGRAAQNLCSHNPASPLLLGGIEPGDRIVRRNMVSLRRNAQLNWFNL